MRSVALRESTPRPRWLTRSLVLLALGLAGPLGAAPDLQPCGELVPEAPEALCGRLSRPEDPARPDGRSIDLHVVVLPAEAQTPERDAVTFLAGGGVSPATRMVGFLARAMPELRRRRDVVLVDQRGTGRSHPLRCPEAESLPRGTPPDQISARCLEEITPEANPRFYTTPIAMDDLDAVREWLGYERWSIWGASYGTKAARVYLRRHPERVRTVVLHGVVPLAESMWPDLFVSGQVALDRRLSRCAADSECSTAAPDAGAALGRLLAADPVEVTLPGRPPFPEETLSLDRRQIGQAVYAALGSTRRSADLPSALQSAVDGKPEPLAEFLRSPPGPPLVPRGVYLSIACSEEIPRLPTGVQPAAASLLDQGEWLRDEIDACRGWPRGELPEDFHREVESASVPVLVLSGEEDSVTPPRYGAAIAAGFSKARHLVLPNRSHDDLDPCVGSIVESFLIRGAVEEKGLACLGG